MNMTSEYSLGQFAEQLATSGYPQPHTWKQSDVQVAHNVDLYAVCHNVSAFCQTQRQVLEMIRVNDRCFIIWKAVQALDRLSQMCCFCTSPCLHKSLQWSWQV